MENFKLPFVIKIIDKILPPLLKKDMDYPMVRKVLILKLTLDSRRKPTFVRSNPNQEKEPKNVLMVNFIVYGIVGLFIALMQMLDNVFVANMLSYAMLIFVLLSVYISEYSEILLDTKAKSFYGALPLGERELALAKNIHIGIYIVGLASVMLVPSLIAGGILHGIFYALIYLVMGIAVTVFCLFLAGGLYFLLLKIFSGEKLKDILNYFQVIMTVGVIVGYQIIPRMINFQQVNQLDFGNNRWLFLLPPAWYSSIFAIVFQGKANWFYLSLSAIGCLVLILFVVLNKKWIVPEFEKQLSKLEQSSTENKSLSWRKRMVCRVFSKTEQERAFMELVIIHLSRDRSLKLKLYPQFANAFILPLIVLFSFGMTNIDKELGVLGSLRSKPLYLALYLNCLLASSVYYIVTQTDDENTAWIYRVLPFNDLNQLIRAGVKVTMMNYLSPIFIFVSMMFLVLYQGKIFADLVIIYLTFLLFSHIMIRITAWNLPFSIQNQLKDSGRQVALVMMGMILIAAAGTVHGFLIKGFWMQAGSIALLIVLNILWWRFGMSKKLFHQ